MKLRPMTARQRLYDKERQAKYCRCLRPYPRSTHAHTYCLNCQKPIQNA